MEYMEKKIKYMKECKDKDGNNIEVLRTKIINKCFKIYYDDKFIKLLFNKYWKDDNDFIEFQL